MEKINFDPDTITAKSGVYNTSFQRRGVPIDCIVMKEGIKYYVARERKNMCDHCKNNITSIEDKATLVAKDLKRAGWCFIPPFVSFDDPALVIILSTGVRF